MADLQLSLIAAVARGGVIGRDGELPWRLRADLRRFKRLTTGHPLVMGRRTHESIGRALPGRRNLVLSRSSSFRPAEGAERAGGLEEALRRLEGVSLAFVIGGAAVYEAALPRATRLDITWVLADVEGDVSFPELDLSRWREAESEDVPAGPEDEHATRYVRYVRT